MCRIAALLALGAWLAAAQSGLRLNRGQAQIERLNRMPPAQRERILSNLPPERKAALELRLERYNKLTPKQRERLRSDYENFQKLPPERQDQLRRSLRQLSELPEERRKPVRQEIQRLRAMPPEERKARIESEGFKSKFNEDERELLSSLSEFAPAPPPEPLEK